MTRKTAPGNRFIKFELPRQDYEDFVRVCEAVEMKQAPLLRLLVADLNAEFLERIEKKHRGRTPKADATCS